MIQKGRLKKILFLGIILTLICGLSLIPNQKPRIKKGAVITTAGGTLVKWKNIKKIRLDQMKKPRRMRAVLNFTDPKKIVKRPTPNDPALQKTYKGKDKNLSRQSAGMTAVRDFAGMNFNANGSGWPPDTCGDVGPVYYVQAVNTSIGIFDKTTGELISATTFDAFFPAQIGEPCDNNNNGDVIVLYDKYNQRWFIMDFAWEPNESSGSYFSVAASKTSDPTGDWWTFCLQADNTLMDDYPKCGVWNDGIYITANMFEFNGDWQFAKIWALKTPDIYNGTLVAQSVIDNDYHAWSLLPVNAKGPNNPPANAPCYLYAVDADEFGSQSSDALYVWTYDVDWNDSKKSVWTGPVLIEGVAPFGLTATGIPQPGTSTTLDSLYGRLMYPANYINYHTHQSVFLCHLVEINNLRSMRWYEIRIDNGISTLYQQGTYAPDSLHRWMGSICGDMNGNIVMGYSVASTALYPSIRYCGHSADDSPGVMGQGEASLTEGSGYQGSYSRWGDYSHMTLDPDDNETFWYTQEYFTTSGNDWQTRIGAFKLSGGSPPPTEDINEAVDNDSMNFIKTGDAYWSKVTDVSYSGNDSAKSGLIFNNQTSSIQTTVSPTSVQMLKFYWKVSSETNYDYLKFYLDGTLQYQISGNVDWQQKTYTLPPGTHLLRWTYAKDVSISSNSDCGWVDKVELVKPGSGGNTLSNALDNSSLIFNSSGDGDWQYQTSTYIYDGDAAESSDIANNQSTSIETAISQFQTIKFYWKVSSEKGYDKLQFYIDDTLKDQISGEVNWQQKVFAVPLGKHTLRWTYEKDYSVSKGADCGWIDKLELNQAPEDPIAEAVDAPELIFSLSGECEWMVTQDDFVLDNDAVTVPSELFHDEEAVMETSISGFTTIKFYWKVSSEEHYDFLKFYIDGILKDQISGDIDWQERSYTISFGTHTLKWVYGKDYSVSKGADTAWIDNLQFLE